MKYRTVTYLWHRLRGHNAYRYRRIFVWGRRWAASCNTCDKDWM